MPPHDHHHHHHRGRGGPPGGPPPRPPSRLIEKLRKLHDIFGYANVEALAGACDKIKPGGDEAAAFLRAECASLNVDLAIAKLDIRLWEAALKRERQVMAAASAPSASAVAIAPLPPHLFRELVRVPCGLTTVVLDGHDLPPGYGQVLACRNLIEARRAVRVADVIVFDAFAGEDVIVARQHVVDLLDPAILKAEVLLAVHYRPHRKLEDVPLDATLADRLIEL